MQITLTLPDSLSQTETFNQSDWLREIATALFQQERISLSRASKLAGMGMIDFQKLLADRGIWREGGWIDIPHPKFYQSIIRARHQLRL